MAGSGCIGEHGPGRGTRAQGNCRRRDALRKGVQGKGTRGKGCMV